MKQVIAFAMAFFVAFAFAGGTTKEVCKEVIGKNGKPVVDNKGNPVKKCTKIKVHRKVEGEKIAK